MRHEAATDTAVGQVRVRPEQWAAFCRQTLAIVRRMIEIVERIEKRIENAPNN